MTDTAQCGRCGAPVELGALFCAKCGVDVTVAGGDEATVALTTGGSPASPGAGGRVTMRQALREATLGEYEVLDELGRGGMATVFRAHDISLDRKVAIKVMAAHLLEGEGMAERFKLEARTAAQLSHPHIIPIYAVKESDATLFFVMKYVEGKPLDEIIARTGPLPIPMVTDILTKVGGALGYAHRRGVVHRDIKPANIMIDEEGTPIVTDFGIAKVAASTGLTITGTTIGTPSYMSPEQCEAKEVTGSSDQYSLGVVAFQMLTGKLPFEGDSAMTIMYKHCHEELPPLSDFRPDCPPELIETITRMVAKDPADRWPSMEAAIQKLGISTTSQTYMDPIRAELMKAAREGDMERLAELSTGGGSIMPVPGATTREQVQGGQRKWMGVAAMVLLLGAVGTVAVLQPWAGAGPETTDGVVDGSTTDASDGASGADGPVAGGPTGGDPTTDGAAPETGGQDAGSQGSEPAAGGADASGDPPAGPAVTRPADSNPPPVRPTVAEVRVAGLPPRVEPGDRVSLAASAVDQNGSAVGGTTFTWSSTNPAVAAVGADGVLTASAPGTTVVVASAGGVEGRLDVTVEAAPAAELVVNPNRLNMRTGDRQRVTVEALDAAGEVLGGRPARWSSSNDRVARVNPSGMVEAVGPGTATVTARVDDAEAAVGVTVALDARAAAEQLVQEYARALEANDPAAARRIFPSMSQQNQQAFAGLGALQDLDVTLVIDELSEGDGFADAVLSGTYAFRDAIAGAQRIDVGGTATVALQPNGTWVLTAFNVGAR